VGIGNTKPSMVGEIDPDESVDFRQLPRLDEPK
jgi:hypothetical protein